MATNAQSTQSFVPIQEIRDGVVILKDGSMKAVLIASSVNMALKSPDEQASIISQFQNFLNSLDFSVQIVIQSRRYDIRPYIALLEVQEKNQLNDLLKVQTREYVNFIKSFTESTSIMTKTFFLVISYTPAFLPTTSGSGSFLQGLRGGGKKETLQKIADFETNKSQLEQRVSVVQQGLVRTGVRTILLGTEEVVELFYRIFNPGEQEKPIQIPTK